MTDLPTILVELKFLTAREGGRQTALSGDWQTHPYKPHLVVDDGEYLGVRFIEGPVPVYGQADQYSLELLYYPQVDYSQLQPGVAFSLREGPRTVATGQVLKGYIDKNQ